MLWKLVVRLFVIIILTKQTRPTVECSEDQALVDERTKSNLKCRCSSKISGVLPYLSGNDRSLYEVISWGTMPKRAKSKSLQKSKKQKSTSTNKRTPIHRNCKGFTSDANSLFNFDFLSSLSTNKPRSAMGLNQTKITKKEKRKDNPKEAVAASEDELDVVFDLKEDKKNKFYEVITVMSDDETPNTVTYEKIYAEEGDKVVLTEKPTDQPVECLKPVASVHDDIVEEIVKETNLLKQTLDLSTSDDFDLKIVEESAVNISDSKADSDNEVVCVAVLDAKTKAEQKKSEIQEIFLSSGSDSDTEITPIVPPIRIEIPFSKYPYYKKTMFNNSLESSFGSNNSAFPFGLNCNRSNLYPFNQSTNSSQVNLWRKDRSFSSPLFDTSSDDTWSSPDPIANTFHILSPDESSSSVLSESSQPQQNFSLSSNNENSSSSSEDAYDSASDNEGKSLYWKVDRETNRKNELRIEEFTDLGLKMHKGEVAVNHEASLTFKVMSYNILAQNLLEQHRYLYKNHDRRALGWARRWSLIYNEIKDENPEIICLQEVEKSYLGSHISKLQDLGYKWVYKKRTRHYEDGVAVFYKEGVFESDAEATVEYMQPGVSVLDRDNVGVVVRLRLRASPSHALVIATTHLLYNPKRSDVKLAQIQLLLAEIDRIAYNKDAMTYFPVIMTGDFNMKPTNGVFNLITEGELLYEGMSRKNMHTGDSNTLPKLLLPQRLGITDRCQHVDVLEARIRGEDTSNTRLHHSETSKEDLNQTEDLLTDDRFGCGTLNHAFNFQSVYPHKHLDGQREATTHHDNWVTVDYIFYSSPKVKEGQKKEEGSLQLLSRLRMPTQDECERFLRYIPNFAFGSDHLPLVGKFLLRLN